MACADDFFAEKALPDKDLLGHDALVHEMAEVMLTARTPLTVMVNGSWGTGKTTFLRSMQRHIDRASERSDATLRAATLWFNPWEHEHAPNILVPFLNALRDRAFRDVPERRADYTAGERSLLAELLWVLIPEEYQPSAAVRASLHPHQIRARLRSLMGRRKRLEAAESGSWWPLHKPQEQLSTRVRRLFIEYVAALRRAGHQRLVIFLDDLDRCRPRLMLDLLDLVKVNLVGSTAVDRDALAPALPVVFVFAIDHQTLIRAVREPASPTPVGDYAKYLDKIFNFRFTLPRVEQRNVGSLVRQLVDSRRPDTIEFLRRPLDAHGTTYERLLVEVVQDHQDLRTVRVIRTLINKLMAFRYARRVEEAIAHDHSLVGGFDEGRLTLGGERSSVVEAARLVVAWHAFGHAWLSTLELALRADGLGLRVLLGLEQRLDDVPTAMPDLIRDLEHLNASASGIRFLRGEILERLGLRDLSQPPMTPQHVVRLLTGIDSHVRRAPY